MDTPSQEITVENPPPTFDELVALAQELHPKLDRWVIEGYVKLHFDGLLGPKGEILPDPEVKVEEVQVVEETK